VADFDRAATTPLRARARAAMEPFWADRYGNPSAAHALGRDAVRAVDEAREQLAELLGCAPIDVVFTSGGTESDAHAVTGGIPTRTGIVLCSAVEHPAVLHAVAALGGATVAVDRSGRIDLEALAATLSESATGAGSAEGAHGGRQVELLSVMAANNELGTINDLHAVSEVLATHAPHATLHTDAVQAAPWLDLSHVAAPAGLVSISAHKFGGPKGVGALVVRPGVSLSPLLHGGGQEWDRRSGTTNVAGIVGMAAAFAEVASERDTVNPAVVARRDRLAQGLCAHPGVTRTVDAAVATLPGTLHLLIDGVDSEPLLFLLDQGGLRASASSACASGAAQASHVLAAVLGADAVSGAARRGALRLSLGHDVTDAEVDLALRLVPDAIDRLRSGGSAALGAASEAQLPSPHVSALQASSVVGGERS